MLDSTLTELDVGTHSDTATTPRSTYLRAIFTSADAATVGRSASSMKTRPRTQVAPLVVMERQHADAAPRAAACAAEEAPSLQDLLYDERSAADVEPSFGDKMYLPSGASVSGSDWKRLLDAGNVFLWLDYSSVPASVTVRAANRSALHPAIDHPTSPHWHMSLRDDSGSRPVRGRCDLYISLTRC